MSLENEIIVVSGLPRSGTSLMMQMLEQGGIPALTDETRAADADNPRGYFEYERAKSTRSDPSWLPAARGKAVKIVSSLLYDLPDSEVYRVIFMRRDLDEVLRSQEIMLQRLGRAAVPTEQMKRSFRMHLDRLFEWLAAQPHLRVLEMDYNRLLAEPEAQTVALTAFLDERPAQEAMLSAVDPSLYRNRKTRGDAAGKDFP